MANFNRKYKLTISNESLDLDIESIEDQFLRIIFEIVHDPGGNNVFGEISVYNLSKASEQKIYEQFTNVTLIAGYEGSQDVIFKGEIINIVRGRDVADTFVTMYCRSLGKAAFETNINKTLPVNSTIIDVLTECSNAFGVPLIVDEIDFSGDVAFGRGAPLQGDPKVILNNLKSTYKFDWFFENGRMVVLKQDSIRTGEVVDISMLKGMVGSPEITEIGANVATKLNPRIRFGTLFTVESITPRVNFSNLYFQDVPETIGVGQYKVLRVTFRGDSHGTSWDSLIEGIRYAG